MKIFARKVILVMAVLTLVSTSMPSASQTFPGCNTCGVLGCTSIDPGQYGNDQCESYTSASAGSNGVTFNIVCNLKGQTCYQDATSITVSGGGSSCRFFDWMMGWCACSISDWWCVDGLSSKNPLNQG